MLQVGETEEEEEEEEEEERGMKVSKILIALPSNSLNLCEIYRT
jgi:hypothetical protein